MAFIRKIKLLNFKRFREFETVFDPKMNIIIGDNEAGKSTIIQAIDIALSGSRNKVESQGLDKLFNADVIVEFMNSEKRIDLLPKLTIELYLSEMSNPSCNGENNSDEVCCDGVSLICEPMDEYSSEIREILSCEDSCFPFEYYSIKFIAFSGDLYTGYRKYMKHIFVDNASINGEYATKEYIKSVYNKNVSSIENAHHKNEYRKFKTKYKTEVLSSLNSRLSNYEFDIRTDNKSNLLNDLTITEDNISLENKGKGRQCFIKTEFALQRATTGNDIDILLLEEPENHLSHINMNLLIKQIAANETKQIFITTHNSLICSRLDLRKAIIINSKGNSSIKLSSLPPETAQFFIKAPNHNILEFVLSSKVLLVEGDAEYILMDAFFKKVTGHDLNSSGVHVISVGGTSFKRYLDIARLLNIRTAVLRDNDGNLQTNCVDTYSEYNEANIKIFYELNEKISTFEISIYETNKELCDSLFSGPRRTLTVLQYMLRNKTDAALDLLRKRSEELCVPNYIQEAIQWVRT